MHLGSYGRDLTPASSLVELLRALADRARRRRRELRRRCFRISSLEPMDCSPEIVELVAASRLLRAAFPSAAAARERPRCWPRCGGRTPIEQYAGARRRHPRADARRLDRLRRHRRLSRRDRRGLRAAGGVSRAVAADPPPRVSVLGSAGNGGVGDARTRCQGRSSASARARVREIGRAAGRAVPRRRRSGRVHRALTLEDGSLAVTGNYLKLQDPAGHARGTSGCAS